MGKAPVTWGQLSQARVTKGTDLAIERTLKLVEGGHIKIQ
jgi:hypothetical protein